jgi:HAD superfamily hydrolase (TIGR01509 family)
MRLRGVIFDVDGTLVDSNDAHANAWVRALREAGRQATFARVRPLIGMGGDRLLPAAAGIQADSADARSIDARRAEIFRREYLPCLRAFAGTSELLRKLKAMHLGLAVASSAGKRELLPLLRLAGAEALIDARATGYGAAESKPDSDVVGVALGRLDCTPEEAVMVGDTPYDVAAARQAGTACIAFRCGGWSDADLSGALAIYEGPLDLLGQLDRSPLADVLK